MVEYAIKNEIIFSNNGTYLEKINAIAEKIHLFGGTNIFFDKDDFYFGGLNLLEIKHNILKFLDWNTNVVYVFPLNFFSDCFLFQVLIAYINKCKKQLTENAFKELEKYLEEKFA